MEGNNSVQFNIREIEEKDRACVEKIVSDNWGSDKIITRGRIHCPSKNNGFVAVQGEKIIGLISYEIKGEECEIVCLASLLKNRGVGTVLVEKVKEIFKREGCKRIWLVTTNDNLEAIRFWQKRGFNLKRVYPDIMNEYRKLKPEISPIGYHGIPIRDEIELEIVL